MISLKEKDKLVNLYYDNDPKEKKYSLDFAVLPENEPRVC